MGLRFNGVDNGEIRNLRIENIESATPIGTELGGKYENIVTQQAPYMNGYSMNMVNGISLTFARNIVFAENVYLNNIISNTGLSYGIALWYDTQVTIRDNVDINNVYAGKKLQDMTGNKFAEDSYPNLIPEACGVRIYDDDLYQVSVNYDEEISVISQKCIIGHTGCIYDDNLYSHIGNVDNEDDECEIEKYDIITEDVIDVASNWGLDLNGKNYLGLILVVMVVIIAVIALIYYFCNYIIDCYDQKTSMRYSELTPLL